METWNLPDRFTCNDQTIRYGVLGQGPPLIVVHGTPWSSFNLRHLIRGLSSSYRVYYYDLLGYGVSDKTASDVSLGMQNKVLAALIDHWQLDCPCILGHDFGGTTVLRTHLLNQIDFSKIILIDPVALSPWGSPFFQHVQRFEEAFAGVPGYIHEAIVRAYVQTAAHQPLDAAVLDRIVGYWTGADAQAAFYRQIAQADSCFTDQVQHLYEKIEVPLLLLWGQEDTWIPMERGQKLHAMIPGAQWAAIPDAGHLVIEEQPEALLENIWEFLGK